MIESFVYVHSEEVFPGNLNIRNHKHTFNLLDGVDYSRMKNAIVAESIVNFNGIHSRTQKQKCCPMILECEYQEYDDSDRGKI